MSLTLHIYMISTSTFEEIAHSYTSALDWMESIGVDTHGGRFRYYQKTITEWTERYGEAKLEEGVEVFPTFVNSLLDIYDLVEIYRSFNGCTSESLLQTIRYKLSEGTKGPVLNLSETASNNRARNFIFEAAVSALLHKPESGASLIGSARTDVGIVYNGRKYWIECKRLLSSKKIGDNTSKAAKQLKKVLCNKQGNMNAGVIALDFTKLLNDGSKLLVMPNDSRLKDYAKYIMDKIIHDYSPRNEPRYKEKSNKILGLLYRYFTIAASSENNILVHVSQWGLNPRSDIKPSEEAALRKLIEVVSSGSRMSIAT